jgi:hypothetical protein
MKHIETHIKAIFSRQRILSLLWVAFLLTPHHPAIAVAAPSQDGSIVEGVFQSTVVLAAFSATSTNGQILVTWETDPEVYNAGFNLYRIEHDTHLAIKLNPALIPSQVPKGATGAAYEFADATAPNGTACDYWLESVDIQSLPRYLGTITYVPERAVPPGLHRVFLPMIKN